MEKIVIFDLGNVVFNFSHMKACAQVGELFDMSAESVFERAFKTGLWGDYERGDFGTDELLLKIKKSLGGDCDDARLEHALCDIFHLNEETVGLIHALKNQGITTAALSNISPLHIKFLVDKWGIVDHLNYRFYSYELQSIKPEPKIFKSVIETLNVDPKNLIFTDDMAANVEAARSHGIDAVLFTETSEFVDELKSRGIFVN